MHLHLYKLTSLSVLAGNFSPTAYGGEPLVQIALGEQKHSVQFKLRSDSSFAPLLMLYFLVLLSNAYFIDQCPSNKC